MIVKHCYIFLLIIGKILQNFKKNLTFKIKDYIIILVNQIRFDICLAYSQDKKEIKLKK